MNEAGKLVQPNTGSNSVPETIYPHSPGVLLLLVLAGMVILGRTVTLNVHGVVFVPSVTV